ncbi:hypothetical protein SRABI66_03875 [Stenotrophomonas lactitubi]|nr:hypothetical protein SRABI66_03875 [Stenotrophomonas lactitubi]
MATTAEAARTASCGKGCSAWLRPAPAEATSTSTSKAGIPWEGGTVWVGRTRRKPFHGGSMAPSMAPTVLPTHTAPPLTDCRDRVDPPCVDESPSKSKISISERFEPSMARRYRKQCRQIAENCRRRGGSGCGGVRGMDAAAKPPGMGLRRPPQPDPSRHPTGTQLLLLPLLWFEASAGAGRSPADQLNLSRRPGCRRAPASGRASAAPCAGRTGCSAAAAPCPRGRHRFPAAWCRSG